MRDVADRNVVVMGVSGCGKSLIGASLALALGRQFIEGDNFHSAESIELMSAGIPLSDENRRGWLETLSVHLKESRATSRLCVLACSALKRRYRDVLRRGDSRVVFVHLSGAMDRIGEQMRCRSNHFMPQSLLRTQFRDLEPLADDEVSIVLDASMEAQSLVQHIIAWLATI